VAGFIPDADDIIPSSEYLFDAVSSSPGAVALNWWQPTTVNARCKPTDLYTSPGDEMRLYSPGVFYVVVEGVANQDVPITVYVRWTVELSEPSLESIAPIPETIAPAVALALNYADYNKITEDSAFLLQGTGNGSTTGTIYEVTAPLGAVYDTGRGHVINLGGTSDGSHSSPQLFRYLQVKLDSVTSKVGLTPLLMTPGGVLGTSANFPTGYRNMTGGLVVFPGQALTETSFQQAEEWHNSVGFRFRPSQAVHR